MCKAMTKRNRNKKIKIKMGHLGNGATAEKTEKGSTYLERRRDTLRDDQASLSSALLIVRHNQISGNPDTIGILRSTDRVQWYSAVTGEGGMDDTVAESEGAIGDGQGSEKTGFFAADVVDSHDYGFVVTKEKNAE
jgi:hypothetical protein